MRTNQNALLRPCRLRPMAGDASSGRSLAFPGDALRWSCAHWCPSAWKSVSWCAARRTPWPGWLSAWCDPDLPRARFRATVPHRSANHCRTENHRSRCVVQEPHRLLWDPPTRPEAPSMNPDHARWWRRNKEIPEADQFDTCARGDQSNREWRNVRQHRFPAQPC